MTIFQNINALVEQAKQMMGGTESAEPMDEGVSPDMAEKIMKYLKGMDGEEEPEEDKDVEKADQARLTPEDEGTTGSDDVEEKVEDVGEVNEKNINEVAKQIADLLIKKSVKKADSGKSIFKALELIVDEQKELKKSVENILSGLGVAEQIKKVNEVQKSQKPINDQNEIQKSVDYIKQQLGIKDNTPQVEQSQSIHKSLAGALEQVAKSK